MWNGSYLLLSITVSVHKDILFLEWNTEAINKNICRVEDNSFYRIVNRGRGIPSFKLRTQETMKNIDWIILEGLKMTCLNSTRNGNWKDRWVEVRSYTEVVGGMIANGREAFEQKNCANGILAPGFFSIKVWAKMISLFCISTIFSADNVLAPMEKQRSFFGFWDYKYL